MAKIKWTKEKCDEIVKLRFKYKSIKSIAINLDLKINVVQSVLNRICNKEIPYYSDNVIVKLRNIGRGVKGSWTSEQINQVIDLKLNGLSYKDIAFKFGVSFGSINGILGAVKRGERGIFDFIVSKFKEHGWSKSLIVEIIILWFKGYDLTQIAQKLCLDQNELNLVFDSIYNSEFHINLKKLSMLLALKRNKKFVFKYYQGSVRLNKEDIESVLNLRINGLTYRDISNETGISHQTIVIIFRKVMMDDLVYFKKKEVNLELVAQVKYIISMKKKSHCRQWTLEKIIKIINLRFVGLSRMEIAEKLGKTHSSVSAIMVRIKRKETNFKLDDKLVELLKQYDMYYKYRLKHRLKWNKILSNIIDYAKTHPQIISSNVDLIKGLKYQKVIRHKNFK